MSLLREKNKIRMLWAEIDLAALKHNLSVIRRAVSASAADLMAVVKADAYGHGMKPVAKVLYRDRVRAFGVASLGEALDLRNECPSARILVLGSFHREQLPDYARYRILPTVSGEEDIREIREFLKKTVRPLSVHVKVDTGMGRLGVWHQDADIFFRDLARMPQITVDGIYTHFANADKNDGMTLRQLRLFNAALESARSSGLKPSWVHAANSMGLLRCREAHFNLVRPGIVLYGVCPAAGTILPELARSLKPILSLRARISFLKAVGKDRPISYGGTYTTTRDTRIATLPVGYSHGYRVGFSGKSSVLLRGRRCPVVGRVTMDQTLVDVGSVPAAGRWDVVTLLGSDGRERISAGELAGWAQTIPYEILCALHSRIPRLYKGL